MSIFEHIGVIIAITFPAFSIYTTVQYMIEQHKRLLKNDYAIPAGCIAILLAMWGIYGILAAAF